MMPMQQAIKECKAICAEKWGENWNDRVYLSVQAEFDFYQTGDIVVQFKAYVNQGNFGHSNGATTDDMVSAFRARLFSGQHISDTAEAATAVDSATGSEA